MVRVAGLKDCELDVTTDAGTADVRDVHGKLTLRTSAGSIFGQRVGGTFDVQAAAGSVKLEVDALTPGEHRIVSQMGAVDVRLVPGLDVSIEARTSLGSVRNGYPSRPGAPTLLRLETDLGSVRVRESHKPGREADGEDRHDWEHDARRWQRQTERWQRRAERHAERWARSGDGPPPWAGPSSGAPSDDGGHSRRGAAPGIAVGERGEGERGGRGEAPARHAALRRVGSRHRAVRPLLLRQAGA
jgi:hypothetical protein